MIIASRLGRLTSNSFVLTRIKSNANANLVVWTMRDAESLYALNKVQRHCGYFTRVFQAYCCQLYIMLFATTS